MGETETDRQTVRWESRETENESINNSETKTFRQQKEPMGTNYRWGDTKTGGMDPRQIGDRETGR